MPNECSAGLVLNSTTGSESHVNHYQHEPSVMMEPPGSHGVHGHFDSNYSVLSTMDTQTAGMLQPSFDAHVSPRSSLSGCVPWPVVDGSATACVMLLLINDSAEKWLSLDAADSRGFDGLMENSH